VAELLDGGAGFERPSGVRPHRPLRLAGNGDPQLHEVLRPSVEGSGVLRRCPQAVERLSDVWMIGAKAAIRGR